MEVNKFLTSRKFSYFYPACKNTQPLADINENPSMKSKILNLLLVFIFLFSCKQKQAGAKNDEILTPNNSNKNLKIEYGEKFFHYDAVDYYSIYISENDATKLLDKQNSKIEEEKYNIILNDEFPKTINEINFIKDLSSLGFKKSSIKPKKFTDLNQIFVEKSEQDGIVFACIPVFRDLLVFKKNNKITGFAKICFECNQSHIIGSKSDTKNFGQGQDYEKLGKILESK